MKQLLDIINEKLKIEDHLTLNLYYIVKLYDSEDGSGLVYQVSESIPWDKTFSSTINPNFKSVEGFKDFILKSFYKESLARIKREWVERYNNPNPNIKVSYASGYAPKPKPQEIKYSDVTVYVSAKWVLDGRLETLPKRWMRNQYDQKINSRNYKPDLYLGSQIQEYLKAYREIEQKYWEQRNIELQKNRDKEDEERKIRQAEFEQYKKEFIKKHKDDPYYQIYGYPWERTDNWVGD
jgi:hypothetical protein